MRFLNGIGLVDADVICPKDPLFIGVTQASKCSRQIFWYWKEFPIADYVCLIAPVAPAIRYCLEYRALVGNVSLRMHLIMSFPSPGSSSSKRNACPSTDSEFRLNGM